MYRDDAKTSFYRLSDRSITGQPGPVNHPQTQHLDLIIQKDAWIIVDIVLNNDIPVVV
jgi:hypothetical protein